MHRTVPGRWAHGLAIVNLFAFRDTNPRNLRFAPDAVGPANDDVLHVVTKAGAQTIAAWGARGRLRGRSGEVGPLLDSPMCLGVTKRGEPRHPLYVPADTRLVPWVPVHPVSDPNNAELKQFSCGHRQQPAQAFASRSKS